VGKRREPDPPGRDVDSELVPERHRLREQPGRDLVPTQVWVNRAVRSELAKGTDNAIGLIGDVEQDSALLASEDNDFLIRMGVSRKLLTEVMYQQKAVADGNKDKSTRRCLTAAEAVKYNVANAQ
jgi:hypothetical protein